MKRITGMIGGVVFGLMVSSSANASSYENERYEYRNVYPRSGVYTYNNGYRGSDHDRYERRVVAPSNNRTRYTTSPNPNNYRATRPYYNSYERHESYEGGHYERDDD